MSAGKSLLGKNSARIQQTFQKKEAENNKFSRFKTFQDEVIKTPQMKARRLAKKSKLAKIESIQSRALENISNCDHDNPVSRWILRYQ